MNITQYVLSSTSSFSVVNNFASSNCICGYLVRDIQNAYILKITLITNIQNEFNWLYTLLIVKLLGDLITLITNGFVNLII